MFENFPYTDMHQLNLDWIVKIAKDFLEQYTQIQNTITTGLESLDTKASELEALLQAWYDTHSADIANQLADALQALADQLNSLESSFNQFADQKLQQTLASIPADYSSLSEEAAYTNKLLGNVIDSVTNNKSIIVPTEWEQGVWGATGKEATNLRIRLPYLINYETNTVLNFRNTGTGRIAYTAYSDAGQTRIDTGYIDGAQFTFLANTYYGIWMQGQNSANPIAPEAGDAVTISYSNSNGIAVFIGDSYTSGLGLTTPATERWSARVCSSLNMIEKNYAVGGTGFVIGADSNTDFIHQVVNAMNDQSFDNNDVRYFFVMGGRNDASNSETMVYTLSQVQAKVSAVIDGIQTHFPNAEIVLIPMAFDADILPQYAYRWYQYIILSCRSFFRNLRIVKHAYTWLTGYFDQIQADGVHPTASGHRIMASNVIDCLNGGDGANNIGQCTIEKNIAAINNNPAMGLISDGKTVFIQSSQIRTITTIAAGTALFTQTFTGNQIMGWCKPQKIYCTLYNNEYGRSYSAYFTMSKTSTTYTMSLIANEEIPLGRYNLYGSYELGRYLNAATGD